MDTLGRAKHESEVADLSERRLRLKVLELAVQAQPDKPAEIAPLAATFLNFLIGLDSDVPVRRE